MFTPSEIGAFAVVYAVAIGIFAYRMLAGFRDAVEGSLVDVGAVMFLLALSAIFGYGIVFERIPEVISAWMLGVTDDPNVVMVLIVLFSRRDPRSVRAHHHADANLPAAGDQVRHRPGAFRPAFIIAATIGNYTPPVGAAMFVVCQVLRCPIGEYTRESVPFLIAVSLVTLLLIFVPGCTCRAELAVRAALIPQASLFGHAAPRALINPHFGLTFEWLGVGCQTARSRRRASRALSFYGIKRKAAF